MNSPDPALVDYIQRRIQRTRHRDAERHTLARREAARIRANAYERMTQDPRQLDRLADYLYHRPADR